MPHHTAADLMTTSVVTLTGGVQISDGMRALLEFGVDSAMRAALRR